MSLDITGRYRYPPPRADWLALHQEDILEPDLPIIDAHHHIWEEPGNPYLLDDFAGDLTSGHAIEATVFVQAHYGYLDTGPASLRPVGETEKIMAVIGDATARGISTNVCAAIIGHADLMLGSDVAAVLDAHIAVAGDRFKGVRHSVSRDSHFPDGIVLRASPEKMLAHPVYREGLATVAHYGLSYDAMLYHQQIPELTAMARALPELPIILDHYGCMIGVGHYAGREAETFREWRTSMAELARCPNVSVKLGGMGMIICGAAWNEHPAPSSSSQLAAAWAPLVESCIELFGVDRCMFESNFPVDKGMYSYATLWNAFKRIASRASVNEKAALFRGTAAQIYRIDL
jgi:L-fuconolactonase